MLAWPSTLPQEPYYEGNVEPDSGLLKDTESNSPIRTRTYPEQKASFVFKQMTRTQMQALRIFWNTTLNQSAPFSAPWLSGFGFTFHFCRMVAPPQIIKNERNFDITIAVEIIAGVPLNGTAIVYGAV